MQVTIFVSKVLVCNLQKSVKKKSSFEEKLSFENIPLLIFQEESNVCKLSII